jgi:hypothetical protein
LAANGLIGINSIIDHRYFVSLLSPAIHYVILCVEASTLAAEPLPWYMHLEAVSLCTAVDGASFIAKGMM